MADHNPHNATDSHDPARQTGEDKGKIKRPQRTDATMGEDDLARGSEVATHEASHRGG